MTLDEVSLFAFFILLFIPSVIGITLSFGPSIIEWIKSKYK